MEIYDVERKAIKLENEMFSVDIASVGNGVYAVKGENAIRSIVTDWIKIEGDDPVKSAAKLMEFEVKKRLKDN